MVTCMEKVEKILEALKKSPFRSGFYLKKPDFEYITKKGLETIRLHAYDFVKKRLAPAQIDNDGKQTPMRNHPIFVAQHATATCCRGCLFKWHKIKKGRELTEEEIKYIVNLLMAWIERERENENRNF